MFEETSMCNRHPGEQEVVTDVSNRKPVQLPAKVNCQFITQSVLIWNCFKLEYIE